MYLCGKETHVEDGSEHLVEDGDVIPNAVIEVNDGDLFRECTGKDTKADNEEEPRKKAWTVPHGAIEQDSEMGEHFEHHFECSVNEDELEFNQWQVSLLVTLDDDDNTEGINEYSGNMVYGRDDGDISAVYYFEYVYCRDSQVAVRENISVSHLVF